MFFKGDVISVLSCVDDTTGIYLVSSTSIQPWSNGSSRRPGVLSPSSSTLTLTCGIF
jgi:hypothetical protein